MTSVWRTCLYLNTASFAAVCIAAAALDNVRMIVVWLVALASLGLVNGIAWLAIRGFRHLNEEAETRSLRRAVKPARRA